MKLSSISLIVATLAGIAGIAVATPVPLRVHALQQVDSYERDIDVYSRETEVAVVRRGVNGELVDNLFTRQPSPSGHPATNTKQAKHQADKPMDFVLVPKSSKARDVLGSGTLTDSREGGQRRQETCPSACKQVLKLAGSLFCLPCGNHQ